MQANIVVRSTNKLQGDPSAFRSGSFNVQDRARALLSSDARVPRSGQFSPSSRPTPAVQAVGNGSAGVLSREIEVPVRDYEQEYLASRYTTVQTATFTSTL